MSDNYLTDYIDDANNFYTHWHKTHIGNRANAELSTNFQTLRNQMKSQLKAHFLSLESQQFNVPTKSIEAISNSINITEEEFMNKLDAQIKKDLEENLDVSKLEALFNTVNGTNGDLNTYLKNAVSAGVDTEKGVQALNEALKIVSDCLKLVEGKRTGTFGGEEASLGGAITYALQNQPDKFSVIGARLREALENWKMANAFKRIKKQSLQSAFNQLQNLAHVLETGKFKNSGKDLTANGLVTLVSNNLVSTSLAEGLAFSMKAKANSALHQAIAKSVGTKATVIQHDDGSSAKITGKTDVSLSNVKVKLEGYDGVINLNIGISSKFYTGKAFLGKADNANGSFSSGSGGTLKEALTAIFSDEKDRYLAYNYLVHGMHTHEMHDLIATRQLLRLFATAGSSQDFAQYMLVNGKIISIWQLVQYAINENTNLGLSTSQGGAASQGIVISIPDRKHLGGKGTFVPTTAELSKYEAAWQRARNDNAIISSARIRANLHLENLAKAIGGKI